MRVSCIPIHPKLQSSNQSDLMVPKVPRCFVLSSTLLHQPSRYIARKPCKTHKRYDPFPGIEAPTHPNSTQDPELFRWLRVGLGTLGVVQELTMKAEPELEVY